MDTVIDSDRLSRQEKLDKWMQSKGMSFKDLAREYGCHWTFPGKVLKAESDEMPKKFRSFLIYNIGMPEELLPPPGDKKKGTTRNQKRYAEFKENRRNDAIQSILEERKNRRPSDISLTVGV